MLKRFKKEENVENKLIKFSDFTKDTVEKSLLQGSGKSYSKKDECDKVLFESYVDEFSLLSKRPCYSDNVTKMILNPIPEPNVNIGSITDGTLTINFTPEVLQFPVYWTWGQVPCVESSTPPWSLYTIGSNVLQLDLSTGVNIFGFELCLNYLYFHYDVKVEYYNGSTLLGSVTRNQVTLGLDDGNSKVFEVCSGEQLIDKVIISTTPTDGGPTGDFLIAQIYYGTDKSSCCSCDERYMNFEFDIDLDPDMTYNLGIDVKPQLIGYNAIDLNVEEINGIRKEANISACDQKLKCCIPFDAMHITATLKLLIKVPCIPIWVDYPGIWSCSSCTYVQDLKLDQTCLTCLGGFNPNINLNDLLEYVGGDIDASDFPILHVSGTMRFKCPETCC